MDFLMNCPRCGTEQWFEKLEYSKSHIIIVCEECKIRLWSDLKFVVVVE